MEPVGRRAVPKTLSENVHELARIGFPKGGFFVEVGGHDGMTDSNTLGFDRDKWRGLMIEPSNVSFAKLRENRPEVLAANFALVNSPEIKTIEGTFQSGSPVASAHPELKHRDSVAVHSGNRFSRVRRKVAQLFKLNSAIPVTRVDAITLTQLLEQMKITEIDIFILDVEGMEVVALEGFSFLPKPKVIVIETRKSDASRISELMLLNGFSLVANFSNFDSEIHPRWAGDHQDFVWVSNGEKALVTQIQNMNLFV